MQTQKSHAAAPLILTLKLDADSFALFDSLRRKHFPPERNFLAAHVTLFHHLPGNLLESLQNDLREICARYRIFELRFPSVRFLGKGSAIEIESVDLHRLRDELKRRWQPYLKPQDLQKFKPHVTVQNKVAPEDARLLYEELAENWTLISGAGVGLQLWHYLNGPWRLAEEFEFEID